MTEIEVPACRNFPVPLELDVDRSASGEPPSSPRLSLGQPMVIELSRGLLKGDREAIASLNQHADHVFHLVRLACTFDPAGGSRFTEAWLELRCLPSEGPMAWSMQPQRDADLDETSNKIKVGAGLKLLGVSVNTGADQGSTIKHIRPFIDALHLHESKPCWHFKATEARELEGSFILAVVLRSSNRVPCSGTIAFRGTVERKRFMVFTFATPAQAPQALTLTIHA
jgi:hypothetical protein